MSENRIRKLTVAKGYINEDRIMNYVVGKPAYSNFIIVEIEKLKTGGYLIKSKNAEQELINWKEISNTVPVVVEYSMNYSEETDI